MSQLKRGSKYIWLPPMPTAMPNHGHDEQAAAPTNLPAIMPPAALVLRRTQTTLGLLREVTQETTAAYWFERGKEAEGNTRWAEAAYSYRHCLERHTDHWRAGVRLAGALAQLELAEAAAKALTEAAEAWFEGWQPLKNELSEPTWHQLRNCLETARSTAQNGFGLLLGLTLVYRALKQKEQARRTMDVMQFMYQQEVVASAQWLRLSGNLYLDAECYSEAIEEYDRAIELKPNLAVLYSNRSSIKMELKDYNGAITDYDRAIELKQNYAFAYRRRASAKVEIEDYMAALTDFDQVVKLKPESANAYYNLGCTKANLKDFNGAIADFNQAIELQPNYVFAYFNRGCAKNDLNDYLGAIDDFDWAIELEPEDADYYLFRGYAKEKLKEYDGSVFDYDQAIRLGPENADYYSFRADVKEEIGDAIGAAADREKEAQLTAGNEAK